MSRHCLAIAILVIASSSCWAIDASADVARNLSKLHLDAGECYRFTDIDLNKGPLYVHLGAGWIIFAEPVRGVRPGAVYISTSDENRVALAPTAISERLALERAVHRTALNEPFGKSVLLFTDGTDGVMAAALGRQHAVKDPAKGAELAQEWASIFAHIADSFHTRLVRDLISGDRAAGVFYMGAETKTVGDIDIFYDPSAAEQAVIGKLNAGHFDILATCCDTRPHSPASSISAYRIDATIQPDLQVSAITNATVVANRSANVLVFSISRVMTVLRAELDGVTVPVFQSQSLRSSLVRDQGTGEFFIVAPSELNAGSVHQVRIEHQGDLIKRLSGGDLLVGARENWYPRAGDSPAQYDLTFRSSPEFTLVASGKHTTEYLDGDLRVSQWKTEAPATYATFNVGRFDHLPAKQDNFSVDVYFPDRVHGASDLGASVADLIPSSDSTYLLGAQRIAGQALGMMAFMTASLGSIPVNSLLISPLPGPFGQNLSGSVFVSSSLYKEFADQKHSDAGSTLLSFDRRLALQTGIPHEVAHQWWGNTVRWATYHDEWITESLANYFALLYSEQANGPGITLEALDYYRNALSRKTGSGQTILDAGPVTWGYRLQDQNGGPVWRTLTYGKGTLIFHRLRTMMGDIAFQQFVRTLFVEFQTRPLSTPDLERWTARYLPQDQTKAFFDKCVNGTSMP